MKASKRTVTLISATILLAGSTVAASAAAPSHDFRSQALASGLTSAQATSLQHRVDRVLTDHPGGRQVSPTKVAYDGFNVTLDPHYQPGKNTRSTRAISCRYGHLCMTVRGQKFDLYKCQTWQAHNWTGNGEFNNNQTRGTVAKFFNRNGSVRWTSTAPQAGTASWGPIWSIRPC